MCPACGADLAGPGWSCLRCGADPRGPGFLSLVDEAAEAAGGFPPESFALLAELEADSFWFQARNDVIAWALSRYFPRARTLLDLGCGTGFTLAMLRKRFPQLAVTGGELFPAGLEVARRRLPGVPLFQLDARHLPFENTFDIVGAFDVLEHIEDDAAVVCEMYRAARAGGGAIVTVPQHPRLWSTVDEFSEHRRRYAARDLEGKLRRAGFDVIHSTSFVTLLLPVLALSRLRLRRAASIDPEAEFRMSPALRRLFAAVMAAERALFTRRGIRLPVGGSLLAVARRAD